MSSIDPKDPWTQAISRQRRKIMIAMVGGLAIPSIVIVGVWFMLQRLPGSTRGYLWPLALVVPVLAAIAIAIARFARQQRGLMKLVPHAGGLVCPKCRIALAAPAEQEPEACPQCGRRYTRRELRQFWETVVRDPMAANQWWIDHHADTGVRGRMAKILFGRFREQPWLIVAANACLWCGAGAIMAASRGTSVIMGLFTFAHMMLFMSGISLIVVARRRGIGEGRHCAVCDYDRGPESGGPDRCPECGSDWNTIGGTVHGRMTRRPGLIISGAAMIVLALATMVGPLVARGWQNKVIPTGLLIQDIIDAPRGFTMDELNELKTRTLTREQVLRLAEGLLDRRKSHGSIAPDEEAWIDAKLTDGSLSRELVDRYYSESLDMWLIAPTTARVGETVTIGIGTRYRYIYLPNVVLDVGGFLIDDDPTPKSRRSTSVAGHMVGTERYFLGELQSRPGINPQVTVSSTKAGPLRVRLKAWVVILPAKVSPPGIQWQADGSPQIPANALWSAPADLEHTITIVP